MAALKDMTEGAPNGAFTLLYARLFMAQQAVIEELQTKIIHLGGANGIELNGEERFIKSKNYIAGESGFKLNADGNAEFNNATFRGHIEADSGTFNGTVNAESGTLESVIIERNSTFRGNIEAGPLEIKDIVSTSPPREFTYTDINILLVKNELTAYLGYTPSLIAVEGTFKNSYNQTANMLYIGFSYYIFQSTTTLYMKVQLDQSIINGNNYLNTSVNTLTGYNMSFHFKTANKSIKIKNLPNNPNGLETGMLYQEERFLKIKS
jgi:hypothetical protein